MVNLPPLSWLVQLNHDNYDDYYDDDDDDDDNYDDGDVDDDDKPNLHCMRQMAPTEAEKTTRMSAKASREPSRSWTLGLSSLDTDDMMMMRGWGQKPAGRNPVVRWKKVKHFHFQF